MNDQSIQIRDLSDDDKPREKLLKYGVTYLSDAELLAIVIGSGTKGNSVIQLSQKLLSHYDNDLNKLAIQHPAALKDIQPGLGLVKSINIIAALELGKRRYISQFVQKDTPLNSPEVSSKYFMRFFSDAPQEEFWMAVLNNANIPIDVYHIAKGHINFALVDIRLICKYALLNNAVSVIIAHNHPSGQLQPSKQDIDLTDKIKNALKTLNIELWDHLIIYQDKYYSFRENQLL
jgi:DNA repair protein RadC